MVYRCGGLDQAIAAELRVCHNHSARQDNDALSEASIRRDICARRNERWQGRASFLRCKEYTFAHFVVANAYVNLEPAQVRQAEYLTFAFFIDESDGLA
jgi:hypothetical protein